MRRVMFDGCARSDYLLRRRLSLGGIEVTRCENGHSPVEQMVVECNGDDRGRVQSVLEQSRLDRRETLVLRSCRWGDGNYSCSIKDSCLSLDELCSRLLRGYRGLVGSCEGQQSFQEMISSG